MEDCLDYIDNNCTGLNGAMAVSETALLLDGQVAHMSVEQPSAANPEILLVYNQDITVEAWINPNDQDSNLIYAQTSPNYDNGLLFGIYQFSGLGSNLPLGWLNAQLYWECGHSKRTMVSCRLQSQKR